jgi:homoserine O-acetyltransferase
VCKTVRVKGSLRLERSSKHLKNLQVRFATWVIDDREEHGDAAKPSILVCPSMSNNEFVANFEPASFGESGERGWWSHICGYGDPFGINMDRYAVVCAVPLGSPFGSTSPLTANPATNRPWAAEFPTLTPLDQAGLHALLLDHLGIDKVHAVIGGSMGGMQALQFARLFPDRWERCVAVASTGATSPSTVALRAVQRAAVRLDPNFAGGDYGGTGKLPRRGLGLARRIGTIGYRSRIEFDDRFSWVSDVDGNFEVEGYLDHAAKKFETSDEDDVNAALPYDANCYITLSKCMDLMKIDADDFLSQNAAPVEGMTELPQPSDEAAALDTRDIAVGHLTSSETTASMPPKRAKKQVMLLPYSTDALMPPKESIALAEKLGENGRVDVHCEVLQTKLGHDAFLVHSRNESEGLNLRISAFLDAPAASATDAVRNMVARLYY